MRHISLTILAVYLLMLAHGVGHAELELCHDACEETQAAESARLEFAAAGCEAACCAASDCDHAHRHGLMISPESKSGPRDVPQPAGMQTAFEFDLCFKTLRRAAMPHSGLNASPYLLHQCLRI